MAPNAVELTVEAAWYIAETVGAGSFPWVLAVTPPYRDTGDRAAFVARQAEELTDLGIRSERTGRIVPAVAEWIRVVCHPQTWLELRFVDAGSGDMLRGLLARRDGHTVVALRSAHLITFTEISADDPLALVPIVAAGLSGRSPARFDEFALPATVGARADAQLRCGADISDVLDHLGIPASAHNVVQAAFAIPRTYAEIIAGCNRDGVHTTTEVGLGIVDTTVGRVVVSPQQAFDGTWVSTFAPGTPQAIAMALDALTASLPTGRWFPSAHLSREFIH